MNVITVPVVLGRAGRPGRRVSWPPGHRRLRDVPSTRLAYAQEGDNQLVMVAIDIGKITIR
jgi:hypothetical protein